MNSKQHILMLTLALAAGLVGGVISSKFLMGQPAFAEKKNKPQNIVEAQEFLLIDENGKARARLGFMPQTKQPGLWLHDEQGKDRISLGLSPEPGLYLSDSVGRVVGEFKVFSALEVESARVMLKNRVYQLTSDLSAYGLASVQNDGRVLAQLRFATDRNSNTSNLSFFDKAGEVIWQAP